MREQDIDRAQKYDVIVVGAGHAGCEAALAAARLGCSTLLLTLNLDFIALPPCNPSIGGSAKGQVVREIDALGGEMARNIDATFIQMRMLNESRGPAVQALRAQMDRISYMKRMKLTLESQSHLVLKQALVTGLLTEKKDSGARVTGVRTQTGLCFLAPRVILTSGTSLDSRIIMGETIYSGGRNGELPAVDLSSSLRQAGLELVRWKTGTPPRIDARTVDFSTLSMQSGSSRPLWFGHVYDQEHFASKMAGSISSMTRARGTWWWNFLEKHYPQTLQSWLPQTPCFLSHTNPGTHEIVRRNFDRAPLFSGVIVGTGPRYCPSFEAKVAHFPERTSHQFFLEPEGWDTTEMYLQGANTSLPEEVQLEFVRSIRGLERAEIVRPGYAIEYDGVSTRQLKHTLESRVLDGLFLAGQINGTSGYEEAAAQGLVAGINAARLARAREPVTLSRSTSYIGVMIDDLVSKNHAEPYRLMTARSEYRLLLRNDNADLRLSEMGHEIGLLNDEAYTAFDTYRQELPKVRGELQKLKIHPSAGLNKILESIDPNLSVRETISWAEFLKRPNASVDQLLTTENRAETEAQAERVCFDPRRQLLEELAIELRYEGYIVKQQGQVKRFEQMESKRLPAALDYSLISGLRTEAREVLDRVKPLSLGEASRLSGVNPSDVAILMVYLDQQREKREIQAPPTN